MAVLKKLKASTLMETLVGTVLIVILFALSSSVLNHMFANSIRYNTQDVVEHLHELQYQYQHQKLNLPYQVDYDTWEIRIYKEESERASNIIFSAVNGQNGRTVTKKWTDAP